MFRVINVMKFINDNPEYVREGAARVISDLARSIASQNNGIIAKTDLLKIFGEDRPLVHLFLLEMEDPIHAHFMLYCEQSKP